MTLWPRHTNFNNPETRLDPPIINNVSSYLDATGILTNPEYFEKIATLMTRRNGFINGSKTLDEYMLAESGESKISMEWQFSQICDIHTAYANLSEDTLKEVLESDRDNVPDPTDTSTTPTHIRKSSRTRKRKDQEKLHPSTPSKKQNTTSTSKSAAAMDTDDIDQDFNYPIDLDAADPAQRLRYLKFYLKTTYATAIQTHPPQPYIKVRERSVPRSEMIGQASSRWTLPHKPHYDIVHQPLDPKLVGPFWDQRMLSTAHPVKPSNRRNQTIIDYYVREESSRNKI